MKKRLALYTIIGIDLTWSFICFKQLWAPGAEAGKMGLHYVLFQPFIQLYALMGIWICSIALNREGGRLPERIRKRTVPLLLFFILAPPVFLVFSKAGFRIGLMLLWGFLDPIKTNYYWGYAYQLLRRRAILLFAASFILLFVSYGLSVLHGTDEAGWPFFMGGLFYLFMAFLDLKWGHKPKPEIA